MKESSTFQEPVSAVLTDHELLAEYQSLIQNLFGDNGTREARRAAQALRHLLNCKVVSHFAYEEEHIFPGLLLTDATRRTLRLLARLQDEHRSLQARADRLDTMLDKAGSARPVAQQLRRSLQSFFTDLQKHAQVENRVFPTLL